MPLSDVLLGASQSKTTKIEPRLAALPVCISFEFLKDKLCDEKEAQGATRGRGGMTSKLLSMQ